MSGFDPASDKTATARGFSTPRDDYATWAVVQTRAAEAILDRLPDTTERFEKIADLGCGHGTLTEKLAQKYSQAQIWGIDLAEGMIARAKARCAETPNVTWVTDDLETFEGRNFSLVTTNYALQWVGPIETVFTRVYNSLAPGGLFALAVPLEGAFKEFYRAYQSALGYSFEGIHLRRPKRYLDAMNHAGFSRTAFEENEMALEYATAAEALHSFRAIGATFQFHKDYQPLSIGPMRRLLRTYRHESTLPSGNVTLTHHWGLFLGEKPTVNSG